MLAIGKIGYEVYGNSVLASQFEYKSKSHSTIKSLLKNEKGLIIILLFWKILLYTKVY